MKRTLLASILARVAGVGLVAAPLLTACGDNGEATVDAVITVDAAPTIDGGDCAPSPALPGGLLGTFDDLPTLDGCVAWGELPTTSFFVRSAQAQSLFDYGYPTVTASCAGGVTSAGFDETYWDGTRGLARLSLTFQDFDYAVAEVFCVRADETLAFATRTCYAQGGGNAECFNEWNGTGGRYDTLGAPSSNVALVGEASLPDDGFDVDVQGDRAYVAGGYHVAVYDLSDPDGFALLGSIDLENLDFINDIEVVEVAGQRIAYVGADQTVVLDVTNPAAIVPVGRLDSARDDYAHTVQVRRDGGPLRLYLGGQSNIPVYDISAPATPVYLTSIPLAEPGTHDMTVDGDRVYVNNEFAGFVALDATDLDAPIAGTRRHGGFYDHASAVGMANGQPLVLHGGEGMESGRATHLRIYNGDTASPDYMTLLGEFATRAETGIHNMILRDGFAYVAYYQDGLRIIDVRDPANPVEVGHYNTWDRVTGNHGPFAGSIGIDLAADGSVVLVDYEGQVRRLRPTLPAPAAQ